MYTQCEHCKAIFRVNMREVTIAKGELRCGECHLVFNATKTLSTTIPKAFVAEDSLNPIQQKDSSSLYSTIPPDFKVKGIEEKKSWMSSKRTKTVKEQHKEQRHQTEPKIKSNRKSWPVLPIILIVLFVLLATQVLYQYRHILTGAPQHQPEKIQILNHNVFTHPNEPQILLISATMENTAKKPQPFPLLELRLNNRQSETVALRRFKPSEYLENYHSTQLLPVKKATSLRLKIKDPGSNATGFQFNFF